MKVLIQKSFILLSLAFLLISFQNCSEDVVFSSADSGLTSSGLQPDLGDTNETPNIDSDIPKTGGGTLPEEEEQAENETPLPPSHPEIPEGSEGNDEEPSYSDCEEGLCNEPKFNTDPISCEEVVRHLDQMIAIPDGGEIKNIRGNSFFLIENISKVENIRGNIYLICLGEHCQGATIGSMSNVRGNITVCGVNIKRLHSMNRGNMLVVGGNIGDIYDFRGNLKLISGIIIGDVENVRGNISLASQ